MEKMIIVIVQFADKADIYCKIIISQKHDCTHILLKHSSLLNDV